MAPPDASGSARARWLLPAVWLLGAAVAIGTGLVAVRLVSSQVGDPAVPPLTADGVQRALSSATATPGAGTSATPTSPRPAATSGSPRPVVRPGATASSSPRPGTTTAPAASRTGTFSNEGGTIGVRCDGTAPRLLYATPADGYRVAERKVDADRVEVRFARGDGKGEDPRLRVVCRNGTPVPDAD